MKNRKDKKINIFSVLLLVLLSLLVLKILPPDQQNKNLLRAEIVRIVDGDTMIFQPSEINQAFPQFLPDHHYRIRLIGIDTPESVHPDEQKNTQQGLIASDYSSEMLLHKTVEIEFDVQLYDSYDRVLGYLWLDSRLYNEQIIKEGFAYLYTVPPNVKYVTRLEKAQEYAKDQQLGFWQK